jgi:hypothetical protein
VTPGAWPSTPEAGSGLQLVGPGHRRPQSAVGGDQVGDGGQGGDLGEGERRVAAAAPGCGVGRENDSTTRPVIAAVTLPPHGWPLVAPRAGSPDQTRSAGCPDRAGEAPATPPASPGGCVMAGWSRAACPLTPRKSGFQVPFSRARRRVRAARRFNRRPPRLWRAGAATLALLVTGS